ncbi:MAG: NUDIX domain-containing protein [Actinomycetota bacterium]|nr:NUDIX domain-containing protein [Actinomycetota bacterium]
MGALDGWTYCPLCATQLQREGGKVECPECGFVTYANSKPTVSALVVDDEGRIMFSKRAVNPSAGKWDLPGGFLEEGEDPIDGLHRELHEEAGIRLSITEFVGAFVDWYETGERSVATLNLYWSARIAEGTPKPADDVAEFRFFSPDDLPKDELAFPHIPDVLSAWRGRNEHT